jgi:hypothetical protein
MGLRKIGVFMDFNLGNARNMGNVAISQHQVEILNIYLVFSKKIKRHVRASDGRTGSDRAKRGMEILLVTA